MRVEVGRALLALTLLAPGAGVAAQTPAATLAATPKDGQAAQKAGGAPEAYGGSGGFVVGGIMVEVEGKKPEDARREGWRLAERQAWPLLWARMSGEAPATAPKLGDTALDMMVRAIEIEKEEVGAGRYVARLAVVFDRARTASYLGKFSVVASSPPFLLLPVLQDAATRYAYEPNPWLDAWLRFRPGETPMDYVRIKANRGDRVLLNAWAAERQTLSLWQNLVERYQVADALSPELVLERSWTGGPLKALLILRFGAVQKELGRLSLRQADGDVGALMDAAVRQADRIYREALHAGELVPDSQLVAEVTPVTDVALGAARIGGLAPAGVAPPVTMDVQVAATDDAMLQDIVRRLRATAGVSDVRVSSFAVGSSAEIALATTLPLADLRLMLDVQGLRLSGNVIRRRRADEAPLSLPATLPPPPAPSTPPAAASGGSSASTAPRAPAEGAGEGQ